VRKSSKGLLRFYFGFGTVGFVDFCFGTFFVVLILMNADSLCEADWSSGDGIIATTCVARTSN
jgi:hypothetical protein